MLSNISFGIMQGRLLPKYQGRYQAHPVGYWHKEFAIARSLGLSCIEFIIDYDDYHMNPFFSENGIREIQDIIQEHGVGVWSVCADYFMEAPLHSYNPMLLDQSKAILRHLLVTGHKIGVKDIVIPCVDQSSFKTEQDIELFGKNLLEVIDVADKLNINISIESDLAPKKFKSLLEILAETNITVNYDSGNSASLGYDVEEEFESYGNRISDVHVKDRILGGGSVKLGEGNVDWNKFFSQLEKINYQSPLIMQAYRDEDGVEIFQEQLTWLKNVIKLYNESTVKR